MSLSLPRKSPTVTTTFEGLAPLLSAVALDGAMGASLVLGSQVGPMAVGLGAPPAVDPDGRAIMSAVASRGLASVVAELGQVVTQAERALQAARAGWLGWSFPVANAARQRCQAAHDLAFLKSFVDGKPGAPYSPPDPADVEHQAGSAVASTALVNPADFASVLNIVDGHVQRVESAARQVINQQWSIPRSAPLSDYRAEWSRLDREHSSLCWMLADLRKFRGRLMPAFRREVNAVFDSAGGDDAVSEAIREAGLLGKIGGGTDPTLAAQLAELDAKLRDLGTSPDGPAPGRATAGLQAQYASLHREIEAGRSRHRADVAGNAAALASRCAAGLLPEWAEVLAIATATPSAFPEGFARDLGQCAFRACVEAGPAVLCAVPF